MAAAALHRVAILISGYQVLVGSDVQDVLQPMAPSCAYWNRLGAHLYDLAHRTARPAALVGLGWWQGRPLVLGQLSQPGGTP